MVQCLFHLTITHYVLVHGRVKLKIIIKVGIAQGVPCSSFLEVPDIFLPPILPFWLSQFSFSKLRQLCSSKTAPKILISSIAMGADYSFELNSIEA